MSMTTLKEINGKHYQECEVIMLPTDKADNALIKYNGQNQLIWQYKKDYYFTQSYLKSVYASSYHLYIISLEEVKDEEIDTTICIFKSDNNLIVCLAGGIFGKVKTFGNYYKVIATTDKSLSPILHKGEVIDESYPIEFIKSILPKPSVDFINVFIDACNSKQPITKALVEKELDYNNNSNIYKTKVNSSNEISIKKVKDTWTKEELKPVLLQLSKDVVEYMNKSNDSKTHFLIDTWIDNNL